MNSFSLSTILLTRRMKFVLFLIFPFLLAYNLEAQTSQDKVVYFNEDWEKCSEDSASYYRIVEDYKSRKSIYKFTDYYITGEKQCEGNFIDPDIELKDGKFVWYYKNGRRQHEISYERNLPIGEYQSWYEDGKVKEIGEYLKNRSDKRLAGAAKINSFWDSTGVQLVVNGSGIYYGYDEEKDYATGTLVKGKKHGKWTGRMKTIKVTYEEEYKKGKLVEGKSIDSIGTAYSYTTIHIPPSPNPDLTTFLRYLRKNISYPQEAKLNKIEGVVYVEFSVDEVGLVTDAKIHRELGYGCDAEALRVLNAAPRWKPGKVRGVRTKVRMILPIRFNLI